MTFKDLVYQYQFEPVWKKLIELYPDQEKSVEGYENVWQKLQTLTPVPTDLVLTVEHVIDDLIPEEPEEYDHVSGWDEKEQEYYAIEYTRWEQWLSMPVDKDTIDNYSELAILAHCLWEMTWSGYEQEDIQEELDSMLDVMKEIKKDLHDEE